MSFRELPRNSQHVGSAHSFTTSDGTQLQVEEYGRRDAPVTVVLAHGWALTRHSWRRVATVLPARCGDLRVLTYDQRGHGDSGTALPGTTTIAQVADDLAELLGALVPTGPVVLVGHSMGGMSFMALAERHPELFASRVAAVALVATSSGELASKVTLGLPAPVGKAALWIEQTFGKVRMRRGGRVMSRYPRTMQPLLRWMLFGKSPQRGDVVETAVWIAGCHPMTMTGFRQDLNLHNRRDALAAMRGIPVVVLAGGLDKLTSPYHARVIAKELPSAELIVFPGAGHMLPLERSVQVTERIARLVALVADSPRLHA